MSREPAWLFGSEAEVLGDNIPFQLPHVAVPADSLTDWKLECA